MHKHAATNMHFDLRLEFEGTLKSWAVPRGASFDQADKRLAVHVENHPIEYGDFEGIIPEGNYGAGAVIVWDRGTWTPIEDPVEGLKKGKLLFDLHGHKLKGRWTLVKIKKSQKDWLLIKERDEWLTPGGLELPEESVLSGRTVEELRDGRDLAAPIRAELDKLGVKPGKPVRVESVEATLAETGEGPFTREGWLFELKLDGYRILADLTEGEVKLLTRRGNDANASFPEIVKAVAALPYRHVILDGEVIAADENGRPSFQRLQQRARFLRPAELRRASLENPVTFYAFDLIAFEDRDLRGLPLIERKRLLRDVLPPAGAVHYLDHFEKDGERVFAEVEKMGLEGLVAKKASSTYRGGRTDTWLKIRSDRTGDFVIVGFTAPKGSRTGLGALHVADYVDGQLTYAGRVGSGFSDIELGNLRKELEAVRRPRPAVRRPGSHRPGHVLGRAQAGVRGAVQGMDRRAAAPPSGLPPVARRQVARGLRPADGHGPAGRRARRTPPAPSMEERNVVLSNQDKVFWPEERYTKGDLVEYYRAISPWLLPYLAERPVVLTRFPDGINGKSFYQKDAPAFTPDWLRTERMWSEATQREIDYFVADDVPSLLYLANLAAIPLHMWLSRVGTLELPDFCVIDLDPKGAPFADVVRIALAVHELCETLGLPHYAKTTGSTGIHVMIPLARQLTYEQSRGFGELLSRVVVARMPEIATVVRAVQRRDGKVYLDYMQNAHGQLIVAPFSVRPLPGAPVSMPITWDEVNESLDLKAFTIKTALERMKRVGDPMAPVLTDKPDLLSALGALNELGEP